MYDLYDKLDRIEEELEAARTAAYDPGNESSSIEYEDRISILEWERDGLAEQIQYLERCEHEAHVRELWRDL